MRTVNYKMQHADDYSLVVNWFKLHVLNLNSVQIYKFGGGFITCTQQIFLL